MLGTDVVKDTGHRALHPEIEAFDRIGVNRAANIFAPCMLNGLVRGEVLADSDKRLPLVAHQVGRGLNLFVEHAFDFIHREIGDHRGAGIAGGRALRGCAGPLYHRQDRALCGPSQTLATPAWWRLVDPLLRRPPRKNSSISTVPASGFCAPTSVAGHVQCRIPKSASRATRTIVKSPRPRKSVESHIKLPNSSKIAVFG
jgi:hypothetical protein